jgi:hypothetical protein
MVSSLLRRYHSAVRCFMPNVSERLVFLSIFEDLNLQSHYCEDLNSHEDKIIGGCIMGGLSLNYYREHTGLYLLTYSIEQSPS